MLCENNHSLKSCVFAKEWERQKEMLVRPASNYLRKCWVSYCLYTELHIWLKSFESK